MRIMRRTSGGNAENKPRLAMVVLIALKLEHIRMEGRDCALKT